MIVTIALLCCNAKKQYDPSMLYEKDKQEWILSRIAAHIYTAPPYVLMADRLKAEHTDFYLGQTYQFNFLELFADNQGVHYFLVERPAAGKSRRVVGGSFTIGAEDLENFREIFVTPPLPDAQLTERSEFLFRKLVTGEIGQYLTMPSYVEWPNEISYYDTVSFEWKLKSDSRNADSISK